jgi:CRP/FNR family transcriptional regulator, cyclic AMP receptor protein
VAISSLLDALGPAERQAVTSRLRPREFRRGHVVFNDGDRGDCLHLLQRGRLEVQLTAPSGNTITVRVVQPGEFVGELALVHDANRRTGRVVALESAETLTLNRFDFDELRRTQPGVDRLLVVALAERVVQMSALTVELLLPPEERIWRRLAVLAEAYGTEPIRMSQDDLAHAAGTVRQTANRVLQRAARLGIVSVERGVIRVIDRHALDGDPPTKVGAA